MSRLPEIVTFCNERGDDISRGEGHYIDIAQNASVGVLAALLLMCDEIADSWVEPEYFLADLGNNDPIAIEKAHEIIAMLQKQQIT